MIETPTCALISDAGTPLFADPGSRVVWQCHQNGIPVHPIPGACSITTALMGTGIIKGPFQFYGFLPPNREEREEAIRKIRSNQGVDLVFLEAPYRLKQILRDFAAVLGKERFVVIAYKLTYPEEQVFWGTLEEVRYMTEELPKGEFVVILPRKKKRVPFQKDRSRFRK
jgi:16S rRNA (cytidine1402-2'-O)-methyltransferase